MKNFRPDSAGAGLVLGLVALAAFILLVAVPLTIWAIHRLPPHAIVPEPGIGWRAEIAASLRMWWVKQPRAPLKPQD